MSNLLELYDPFRRRTLSGHLDIRRAREADVEFGTYVRPRGRGGLHVIRRTCNPQEVIVSSSLRGQTFAPGAQVPLGSETGSPGRFIIGNPPPGRRGSSRYPIVTVSGSLEGLGITSASPKTLDAGSTNNLVTLKGFGFSETPLDVFRVVVWNGIADENDPWVTVFSPTWVDSLTVTVLVSILSTAPLGHEISYNVERA